LKTKQGLRVCLTRLSISTRVRLVEKLFVDFRPARRLASSLERLKFVDAGHVEIEIQFFDST